MNHKEFAKKMKSHTVLYVEDDIQVREQITEFLTRYCKEVYSCESGEEGFELYKKHQPDILLLDINLPGLSGIELASMIRENDKKTRILISTAYTNNEFMLKAIELGLTRYLVKPVTSEELFNAFEKCLTEFTNNENIYLGDGYSYNKSIASIIKNDKKITLRKKEAELLEFFISCEDEVIRYDVLEDCIWDNRIMTRDAIRSQIRNIRQKIDIELFENISGIGYKFKTKL
jgi:DNA-binding response OmpR family regulator